MWATGLNQRARVQDGTLVRDDVCTLVEHEEAARCVRLGKLTKQPLKTVVFPIDRLDIIEAELIHFGGPEYGFRRAL